MRILCEKVLDHGNAPYVCFEHYEKTFDRVGWAKMQDISKKKLGKELYELYMKQKVVARIMNEESH